MEASLLSTGCPKATWPNRTIGTTSFPGRECARNSCANPLISAILVPPNVHSGVDGLERDAAHGHLMGGFQNRAIIPHKRELILLAIGSRSEPSRNYGVRFAIHS